MSEARYITGGTLVATGERLDLAVLDGKIQASAPELSVPEGAERVDATGRLIVPGACDLNVHLFPPAGSAAETLESGCAAARSGGVSQVLAMPDAPSPLDSPAVVRARLDEVRDRAGAVGVQLAAAMTRGLEGRELTNFYELKELGVKFLCDVGRPVENPAVLRRAMDYARDFDLVFGTCSETPALSPKGCINEGRMSYELGLPALPVCGEDIAVARDIRLAESVDARLHLQRLSSGSAVEILHRAKERGVRVSAEVGIHHLVFTEADVGNYDTRFKLFPPLRLDADREALIAGLVDGTVDCLVSAHQPQTAFSKALDFANASAGMTGLETTLLVAYDRLVCPGLMSWGDLVRVYSTRPREIMGLSPIRFAAGERAEFSLFDPEASTELEASTQASKSVNSPFLGRRLRGAVQAMF